MNKARLWLMLSVQQYVSRATVHGPVALQSRRPGLKPGGSSTAEVSSQSSVFLPEPKDRGLGRGGLTAENWPSLILVTF
jgi:hypothetical protein